MDKQSVPIALALAISTSVGFACGYAFNSFYGEAHSAAAQAVFEAQATQRVLQSYEPIVITSILHKELINVKTMDDVVVLRQKYADSTVRNIDSFERQSSKLELPHDRRLAAPFLEEAATIRGEVERHR